MRVRNKEDRLLERLQGQLLHFRSESHQDVQASSLRLYQLLASRYQMFSAPLPLSLHKQSGFLQRISDWRTSSVYGKVFTYVASQRLHISFDMLRPQAKGGKWLNTRRHSSNIRSMPQLEHSLAVQVALAVLMFREQ
jgi:hypothetical protein